VLTIIQPGPTTLERATYVPPFLEPLADAIRRGAALEPPTRAIVSKFGFDSFMYGATAAPYPHQESKSYVFTTLPRAWVQRYDQQAYIEVDPRVKRASETSLPLLWDQASERGKGHRIDSFLVDAAAHGVGSGVAFGAHDLRTGVVLVALNSSNAAISVDRRAEILRDLGNILLFGLYFHEVFMSGLVQQGVAPRSQGAPLTSREYQCLTHAARGLTSSDIARRLEIAERTVEFHFAAIRSKLSAANRQEAVAKAIAAGLIRP
jgi:LuxR family transcriptional regulator, quorum-sensing system regulator LasR